MTKTQHTPQAEQLADAILRASGSGLRHYTMHSIREAILNAAQKGIHESRAELLDLLADAREHIKGEVDVIDGDYGVPAPDKAMILSQAIDAAIAKATRT